MDGYKYINHPADIAVEVTAGSIEKLFEISADAWKSSVIEKSSSESPFELHIDIESLTKEELLVEFLSELNFNLFSRNLVFSKIRNIIIDDSSNFRIRASVYFEDFNPSQHKLKNEIKAITFHLMDIKEDNGIYTTKIVFDI